MKEDFLHYLWKFQKFSTLELFTATGEAIQVLKVGNHNLSSVGPDFFLSQLIINNQKWVGNIEIHLRSSDWYAHNHQTDVNYDSVILHVVWEDDVAVFRKDNTKLPTLILKDYVTDDMLKKYYKFFDRSKKKE